MPDFGWNVPTVLIVAAFCWGIFWTVQSFVARPSAKASRRWLETNVGGSSPRLVEQLAPLLRGRDRARTLGALIGSIIGLATTPSFSSILARWWYLPLAFGALAGALGGVAIHTVVQVGRSAPPPGVRVASSNRPRTRWFVSPVALAIYAVAAAAQLTAAVVGLATNEERQDADIAFVVIQVVVIVGFAAGSARYLTWLLRRPLYAGDANELRTAVAWRRDQIDDVVGISFSVLIYRTMIANTTVSSGSDWAWRLTLVSTALACIGLCLQSKLGSDHRPVRAVPPTRLPDTYEPAPGTNGWVFSRPIPGSSP